MDVRRVGAPSQPSPSSQSAAERTSVGRDGPHHMMLSSSSVLPVPRCPLCCGPRGRAQAPFPAGFQLGPTLGVGGGRGRAARGFFPVLPVVPALTAGPQVGPPPPCCPGALACDPPRPAPWG